MGSFWAQTCLKETAQFSYMTWREWMNFYASIHMSNFHPIKLKWLVASICHAKYWSVTEIVTCILLTSNQMIFLLQFGINKQSQIFQRQQIALALRARSLKNLLVFLIYFKLHSKSFDYLYKFVGGQNTLKISWPRPFNIDRCRSYLSNTQTNLCIALYLFYCIASFSVVMYCLSIVMWI